MRYSHRDNNWTSKIITRTDKCLQLIPRRDHIWPLPPFFTHLGVASDMVGPSLWEKLDKLIARGTVWLSDYWAGQSRLAFVTCICNHLLWVNYFVSLRISFFIFKMGVGVIPAPYVIKYYKLKCASPYSYFEVLTPRTSECDYLATVTADVIS